MQRLLIASALCLLVPATSAYAQLGGALGQGVVKRARQVNDLRWTDEEKAQLGATISEKVRARYGVVQDRAVHTYVTLVGTLVARESSKPDLPWTFIVLDTDAVNAFAAPHGYVHITKGALALARSEAELAGVLAHEVVHVAEEHTVKALRSQALKSAAAEEAMRNNNLIQFLADAAYDSIIDNAYSRGDENEADGKGIVIANGAGYAPTGLGAFLTTLSARNEGATEKRGMFDSHPGMKARLDRLSSSITKGRLSASVELPERYRKTIRYTPVPQAAIATVADGTRGLASGGASREQNAKPASSSSEDAPKEAPKRGRFGLSNLAKAGGGEAKSADVVGSGGARGLDPEKDARGGPNPAVVTVRVTPADVEAFRKAGGLA